MTRIKAGMKGIGSKEISIWFQSPSSAMQSVSSAFL